MNTFPGNVQPARQWNPQLLRAMQVVSGVRREMQSLLPEALRAGVARVSEVRIRRWQAALEEAVSLLGQIPVILIFLPPPFAVFIQRAVNQIEQVLDTLADIPIASPRIYPPRPGWGIISLETLRFMLDDLGQAEALLYRALQAA